MGRVRAIGKAVSGGTYVASRSSSRPDQKTIEHLLQGVVIRHIIRLLLPTEGKPLAVSPDSVPISTEPGRNASGRYPAGVARYRVP